MDKLFLEVYRHHSSGSPTICRGIWRCGGGSETSTGVVVDTLGDRRFQWNLVRMLLKAFYQVWWQSDERPLFKSDLKLRLESLREVFYGDCVRKAPSSRFFGRDVFRCVLQERISIRGSLCLSVGWSVCPLHLKNRSFRHFSASAISCIKLNTY